MRVLVMAGAVIAAMSSPAAAQGLITEKALSMEMAQAIVQGTIERCRADGFRASVAVIDAGGHLKAFVRDEGTGLHTIDLAQRKAYTALTFATRFPSSLEFAKARGSTLGSAASNVEGTVGVGGGVPIKVGNVAIGAVGVSGAVGGDKDEICANAGIAKVAHLLK